MHETLGASLVELVGLLADPRQDGRLLAEAGVGVEPTLLPLLVRLGARGSAGVVELAAALGRDHSTMSRQLARLEALGLVERAGAPHDRRSKTTRLTGRGEAAVAALAGARERLLDRALAGWPPAERDLLATLLQRFAATLKAAASS